MNDVGGIFFLLRKGCESIDSHYNIQEACDYFQEARDYAKKVYGEDSKICNIINLFDYAKEENDGDYRAAAIKLADAADLLEHFIEQDVKDEFTDWIYSNKDEMMDEAIAATLRMFSKLDFDFSLENIMLQLLASRNNIEEAINRGLIDSLGLPRKFHYVIQALNMRPQKANSDILSEVAELMIEMKDMKDVDFSNLSDSERAELVIKFYGKLEKYSGFFGSCGLSGGMSKFIKNWKENMDYDFVRGMIGLGHAEFAESFLDRVENKDYENINHQMKMLLLKCYAKYEEGDRKEANKFLEDIMELLEELILQVFFLKEEMEKIKFLNGLAYFITHITHICYQIRGAEEAYALIVRNRTLSFDRIHIHLDSGKNEKMILKLRQLERQKKQGINVAEEKAELFKHLEKESQGIFNLNSSDICKKLTDKQAILEFAIMTDINDYSCYYVFIVTNTGVLAVNLGKCSVIDSWLDKLLQVIEDFTNTKNPDEQIKLSESYYKIYKSILCPIGEVLPRSVNTLLFAATGKFFRIPFGMLPSFYWYDVFMEEEYHIIYINSGKEVLRESMYESMAKQEYGAVVVGAPDFVGKRTFLPASLGEVEAVANILNVSPITGKEAVSDSLKKTASIIHISTHSFDLQGTDTEKELDPMDQIGLELARGELLTVRKISQLDLSKTELVMLSVCGVEEGEGVYSDIGIGIRRAFINAGARHIILNLWKTDDFAAQLLMKCFYRCYIDRNMEIEEALRKSKHFLRTSTVYQIKTSDYYDNTIKSVIENMELEQVPYSHPYYWAGFILVGI